MERIKETFNNLKSLDRKALITYLVAGDPDLNKTLETMNAMVEEGADILELGISFSDPMAEGPTIQKGHERALANNTTLQDALNLVSEFRKKNKDTPIVLMGYLNPFEAMGLEVFCKKAKESGVDGVLIVDMPLEESSSFSSYTKEFGLDLIRLIAPTTDKERARSICSNSSGYIYYISLKGITGAKDFNSKEVKDKVLEIKKITELPVAIGFGIKSKREVKSLKESADGLVAGSVFVDIILSQDNAEEEVRKKTRELSKALNSDG
tara:strand:- start:8734 stop:9531 length:798 start_codon:yes stop_codon:yes gene_type:complete